MLALIIPALLYGADLDLVRVPGQDLDGRPTVLRADAAAAWLDLVEYAARCGHDLRLNYAHRTAQQQAELHARTPKLAAPVGKSMHEEGSAVDVQGTRVRRHRRWVKTPLRRWLEREAPAYGFRPSPTEWWHLTYVGTDVRSE